MRKYCVSQAQFVADKEDSPTFDQSKNSSFERNKDAAFCQMKRSIKAFEVFVLINPL